MAAVFFRSCVAHDASYRMLRSTHGRGAWPCMSGFAARVGCRRPPCYEAAMSTAAEWSALCAALEFVAAIRGRRDTRLPGADSGLRCAVQSFARAAPVAAWRDRAGDRCRRWFHGERGDISARLSLRHRDKGSAEAVSCRTAGYSRLWMEVVGSVAAAPLPLRMPPSGASITTATNSSGATSPASSQPITSAEGSRPSKVTPYELICKAWTDQPERFTINPLHQMPGSNS